MPASSQHGNRFIARAKHLKRAAILLTCLALPGLPDSALAQSDEEKAREQLQQLEKSIKRVTWELSNATSKRGELQRELREAEVQLGELNRDITNTRNAIEQDEAEQQVLQERVSVLEAARDEQQARIALELRSAWRTGNQGQLKILLNQEQPDTIARAMAYYRYLYGAREDLLTGYRETLTELQQVQSELDATLAKLIAQREQLESQQQSLATAQAERKRAVANLNSSIRSKGEQLEKLKADRRELEKLLQAIEEAIVNLKVPDNYQPFASARGKMPWPVAEKISNHFGKSRNAGKMRWQGVTIPAKEGTTVRAIHHGRVVYADWLRGSGLLLIIDHGDGYMSLYAHNQSLLRDVGEWVNAGTPIATVGSTGGREKSGLYFEVRRQGKPIDPAKWCTN